MPQLSSFDELRVTGPAGADGENVQAIVPNLNGKPRDKAVEELRKLKFIISEVSAVVAGSPPGVVVGQQPKAQELVALGSTVTIALSAEPQPDVKAVLNDAMQQVRTYVEERIHCAVEHIRGDMVTHFAHAIEQLRGHVDLRHDDLRRAVEQVDVDVTAGFTHTAHQLREHIDLRHKELLESIDPSSLRETGFNQHPVGTGPFKIKTFAPAAGEVASAQETERQGQQCAKGGGQ